MFWFQDRQWSVSVVEPLSPGGARRVVTGRRHRPTYLVPVRSSRKQIQCESALERDYVVSVSVERDVTSIMHQPHSLHLRSGSIVLRYTPDFAVERATSDDPWRGTTIVEVKPEEIARKPAQKERLSLVGAAYAHLALAFELVTDARIHRGAGLTNARLIRRHACTQVPEDLAMSMRVLLLTGTVATVGECLAAVGGAATMAHVLGLAYAARLALDLTLPIGPATSVAWHDPPGVDALAELRDATFAPRAWRDARRRQPA